MIFQSDSLRVTKLEDNVAELQFDNQKGAVNKFDQSTIDSLGAALDALEADKSLSGLLISSGKPAFNAGADVSQIASELMDAPERCAAFIASCNQHFNRLQNLPFPSCVAINGFALGGGLEVALAADFRVLASNAKIGLPETGLGLIPGWGGTARLPRIIGIEQAINWITTGKAKKSDQALKAGAVDAVADGEELRSSALQLLHKAIAGKLDFIERRQVKSQAINESLVTLDFAAIKADVTRKAGKNYPAALKAVQVIEAGWNKSLQEALQIESAAFAELVAGPEAKALVGVFVAEQYLSKQAKIWEKKSNKPINQAAVLGAGIMGGGIAYQSALTGTAIKMKDIFQEGLDLGVSEATQLLSKSVEQGRMSAQQMDAVLNSIEPTLKYDGFESVDIVVEAVVENIQVKQAVLAETEQHIRQDAVLASNTSTISITQLAQPLQRPENFCGMHFFNPVHKMPLVEVIYGEKTSDQAIAQTVALANKMHKKAVVVKDCPGFLVNRVLFPYLFGFCQLVNDGADFQKVDKVMEQWGWPMGPAYLSDVIGIDTCVHAGGILSESFPDRMQPDYKLAISILLDNQRLGQKNGVGFYQYAADERGRLKKSPSDETVTLLAPFTASAKEFSDEEIVARCMLPMAIEMARCLEEGIVTSPAEADMSLLYGLGFPSFRGGIMRWVDTVGLDYIINAANQYQSLGTAYIATENMKAMHSSGKTYY